MLLWTLWLLLGVGLIAQARTLLVRELAVPPLALDRITERLAASGLVVRFGGAAFDPQGHLLLRQVSLRSATQPEPLLTADAIYLKFNPWSLPLGAFETQAVEVVNGRLHVPAMLSPSGRSEPLVDALNLRAEWTADQKLNLRSATARVGPLRLTADGVMQPLPPSRDQRGGESLLQVGLRNYPAAVREVTRALAALPASIHPVLALKLRPDEAHLAMVQATLSVGRIENLNTQWDEPRPRSIDVTGLQVTTKVALTGQAGRPMDLAGRIERLSAGAGHLVGPVSFTSHLPGSLTRGELVGTRVELLVDHMEAEGLRAGATHLAVVAPTTHTVQADGTTWLENQPWSFSARVDPRTQAGTVSLIGSLPYRLVGWAGERTGMDLTGLLQFDQNPQVEITAELAAGGRPVHATGRLSTGPVVARKVALDETAATFDWRPDRLRFDDIVLAVGPSRATGSYEMDPATLEFRFLLAGQLEPAAINGWFREWWRGFWTNFDFPPDHLPHASVDIGGRWKEPRLTRVFVQADGPDVALKGVPLSRVRTRLWVRPEYTDVIEFIGDRPEGTARGSFQRSWDQEARAARWTAFDVVGSVDLDAAAGIFPDIGPAIVAPFQLANAPKVHVRGRAAGPADRSRRPRLQVDIAGEVPGAWRLYDFPLDGLSFRARQLGDVLTVHDIVVGFAGGRATGEVALAGAPDTKRLIFDLALEEATLGEAIHTVESWAARRRGRPEPAVSRFQERVAAGRLDLALTAEGPVRDPYAFTGAGNAAITEAELGEVNLLGILSQLMRRTLFNFSTLELDTARANFDLAGDRLIFSELNLSGPQATIESSGNYRLSDQQLAMTAKVLPFDSRRGALGSAMDVFLTPLSNVLEVKLTGTLADPSWAFSYGPTSFLRALIGDSDSATAPSTPVPAKETAPAKPPQPASVSLPTEG